MPPDPFDRTNLSSFGDATDRAIDRFWDHVSQGLAEDAGGVDPADAATIRHVHRFDDRPDPAKPFVRQLREDLMTTHAIPISSVPRPTLGSASGTLPNGRAHRYPPRVPAASPSHAPAWARLPLQVTAAALILLVIGLGVVSYLTLWPDGDDRGTTVPAAVGPAASPSPDTTAPSETLIEVELPAEMLPHGDKITGSLHDSTIVANGSATWTAELGACCVGVRIDYLLSGNLTARSAGPVQLIHAGGGLETVDTGTDVTLGPGDALIFPNQTETTYTNAWANQAELLTWVLYDSTTGAYDESPVPPEFAMARETLRFDQTIPPGPAILRLQRIELAEETTLPATEGALQFGTITSEFAPGEETTPRDVGYLEDGAVRNFGAGPAIVYVMALASGPSGSDAAATDETLLEVELPAEAMPYGNTVMGGLNHQTLPAGVMATWGPESGACCPGIRVDYVLSGTYSMQSNMAGWVVRAGESNLEGVAAGADLVVGPGDTSIFQNEATITYANSGPDPVEMLFWIVFDGASGGYSTDPIPAGAAIHDSDIRFTLPSIPFGPALVRLRLVELAPEERLAPASGTVQFAVTLPPSMPGTPVAANRIATESDGTAVNLGSATGLVYVLTWEPSGGSVPASPTA